MGPYLGYIAGKPLTLEFLVVLTSNHFHRRPSNQSRHQHFGRLIKTELSYCYLLQITHHLHQFLEQKARQLPGQLLSYYQFWKLEIVPISIVTAESTFSFTPAWSLYGAKAVTIIPVVSMSLVALSSHAQPPSWFCLSNR